jgi:hypothetical protein
MVRIRRMSGVQMSLLCIPAEHCDWGQVRGFFVQVRLFTWWTSPQETSSAAWCRRIASSSGPSSRQYTFPSGLWYSSIWRTPNWSAFALGCSRRSARDGLGGQHQILVKVHESFRVMLLLSDELMLCLPAGE